MVTNRLLLSAGLVQGPPMPPLNSQPAGPSKNLYWYAPGGTLAKLKDHNPPPMLHIGTALQLDNPIVKKKLAAMYISPPPALRPSQINVILPITAPTSVPIGRIGLSGVPSPSNAIGCAILADRLDFSCITGGTETEIVSLTTDRIFTQCGGIAPLAKGSMGVAPKPKQKSQTKNTLVYMSCEDGQCKQ